IAVMTSLNRDGDVIAECIKRFGYLAPRGSSSSGGFFSLGGVGRGNPPSRGCPFHNYGPPGAEKRGTTAPKHLPPENRPGHLLLSHFNETQDSVEELGRISDSPPFHARPCIASSANLGNARCLRGAPSRPPAAIADHT